MLCAGRCVQPAERKEVEHMGEHKLKHHKHASVDDNTEYSQLFSSLQERQGA